MIAILILLVIVIVVIILITKKKKKTSIKKNKKNNFRNQDGFGNDEFQKKMVMKLSDNGWEAEAIAKELNLKIEEVNKILKSIWFE